MTLGYRLHMEQDQGKAEQEEMRMSCLFTLVSGTMEPTTDVNVREETKGLWVCAGCSWAWICWGVCVLGRGEEGV